MKLIDLKPTLNYYMPTFITVYFCDWWPISTAILRQHQICLFLSEQREIDAMYFFIIYLLTLISSRHWSRISFD